MVRRLFTILAAEVLLLLISSGMHAEMIFTHSDDTLTFSTGRLTLGLNTAGGNVTLAELKGRNANLLGEQPREDYIWKMVLSGPDSSSAEIKSGELQGKVEKQDVDEEQAKCRLIWPAKLPDGSAVQVRIDVSCRKDDNLSHWHLSAKIPDGWKVAMVEFPCVPNVRGGGGLKLAAPVGWGLEYQDPGKTEYGGTYPSCVAAMQFMALYRPTGGVYIGCHDKTAGHKYLHVGKGSAKGLVSCKVTNWTALTDSREFELPYDAVVGVIENGYLEAASIYRSWVRSAQWDKTDNSKRKSPKWLKDTDLWLVANGDSPDVLDALKKARSYFDVSTSIHWYKWHQIPFDTLYPEYFPPKPGWPDEVKEMQKLGYHVMPYINGRLWDPASESWKNEHAEDAAARKEDGGFYTEVYGSKVPLNVMCPSTELWQNKVTGLLDALINKYRVDGVYIDQIGAAGAERCFNASHPHPIGGGDNWARGYRTLLQKVRTKLRPDTMITTEENAEPWNDLLDAMLLVNTPTRTDAKTIPLYPAVYSGSVIPFGFQYIAHDDLDTSLPFRMKMARCFLWGSQLGWVDAGRLMDEKYASEAEFLRNLARARSKAHRFVLYGQFLGEAKVEGDNPALSCEATASFGGSYTMEMPSVMATKWRSSDGKIGIAVCNMSNEPRTVKIDGREIVIGAREGRVTSNR